MSDHTKRSPPPSDEEVARLRERLLSLPPVVLRTLLAAIQDQPVPEPPDETSTLMSTLPSSDTESSPSSTTMQSMSTRKRHLRLIDFVREYAKSEFEDRVQEHEGNRAEAAQATGVEICLEFENNDTFGKRLHLLDRVLQSGRDYGRAFQYMEKRFQYGQQNPHATRLLPVSGLKGGSEAYVRWLCKPENAHNFTRLWASVSRAYITHASPEYMSLCSYPCAVPQEWRVGLLRVLRVRRR